MKAIANILSLLTTFEIVCTKNLPPREETALGLPAILDTTHDECHYDHLSVTLLCQSFAIDFSDGKH